MAVDSDMDSGKILQFDVSHASTVGELRRRIMLASGGMQKITLMVENTIFDGDTEQLIHFTALGLDHGAQLTVVVSEALYTLLQHKFSKMLS